MTRIEQELNKLKQFKAEITNLADSSLDESSSDGFDDTSVNNVGNSDGGKISTKWKQRAKQLQIYTKWQLADSEARVNSPPL